jgi:vancomycin resistance protein YoaR
MPQDNEGQHAQNAKDETLPSASSLRKRVISLGRARVVGLACLPLLLFALLYARFAASQSVLSGVTLAGARLGGASATEAKRRLSTRESELVKAKLRVVLASKSASVSADELGIGLRVDQSVAFALTIGRDGALLANMLRYLRSWGGEQELPAVVRVDAARFGAALSKLEAALVDEPPQPGGLAFEGAKVSAVPARPGRKIAVDAARRALTDAVAHGRTAPPIALSADVVTPELAPGTLERALLLATHMLERPVVLEAGLRRIDIQPAELGALLRGNLRVQEVELGIDPAGLEAWTASHRAGVEAEARDAGFEVSATDQVRVVPGEPGVRLDTSALGAAILSAAQSSEHRAALPILHEPAPARSTEQAEKLGIRQLVGSFTTRHPCCQPRVDNIHRIALLLDGLVAEPGQTVSINAIVGPRTQKNGFVLAPSIEDGEMVDSVGGGVSQFATTIFNALFHAGYDIIERQPHTYWFPRYPMGHDATLGFPRPDIVFKNDSNAGLLVKTSFTTTTITVKLYGDVAGRRVTSSVSERRDIVQPALELLPNREVPPDDEKVKEGGMIGWSVIAGRVITFADGTKKEEKRKVTYKPKPRRVEVHPCKIPKGEPGATGEPCPKPPPEESRGTETEAPPQSG